MTKAIILGCGSSGGVPRIDGYWGNCNPDNPKNNRTRCSLLIKYNNKNLIIDTSPDMRFQLLREKIYHIETVIYTHDHADQTHGIDDIRAMTFVRQKTIPAYADPQTADILESRFKYIFHGNKSSGYPAIMSLTKAEGEFFLDEIGLYVQSFPCVHGNIISRGYVIGDMAYSPDVNYIENDTLDFLKDQKLSFWIVDCLRYSPHVSHAHFDRVMEWFLYVKPKKMILTNLHFDLDYEELSQKLPPEISAAYDGYSFEFKI